MKTKATALAIIFALIPSIFLANNLPNGIVFRVIINDQDSKIETEKFDQYQPINYKTENKLFTYEIGAFKDYIHAQKAKNEVKTNGYVKADIVAYFNNRPVSLDDAFVLLDNQNHVDQFGSATLSEEQMDEMLAKVEKPDFFYTVQIGVFNSQQVNSFFDLPKTIDERVASKGNYRYTYGRYYTIHDARAALDVVKENGLSGAFITAYDDVERIPLSRAMAMEEKFLDETLAAE